MKNCCNMNLNIVSHNECERILYKYNKGKKLLSYKISKFSDKIEGYLADYYLLTMTFTDQEHETLEEKTFFVKCAPKDNDDQSLLVKKMDVFDKEILMYKNLISEFLSTASKNFAPEYYFSKPGCIVLEDMSSSKYKVHKIDYLDFEKCKSALNMLARFHASSIIYEEKRSTKEKLYRINEHFVEEVVERSYSFEEGHPRYMWCKNVLNCLEQFAKYFAIDSRVNDKLREYVLSEDKLKKMLKPSQKYRNVVCHDDLWQNNFLFNENDECILIDFQLTKYSPPIFDVLLMLYTNIENNYLTKNLPLLLNMYYEFLKNELLFNGLEISKILPKRDFLESAKDYKLPAFVKAAMYGTNSYLPEKLMHKILSDKKIYEDYYYYDRFSVIGPEFESNLQFRNRLSNILKPFFEYFEKA